MDLFKRDTHKNDSEPKTPLIDLSSLAQKPQGDSLIGSLIPKKPTTGGPITTNPMSIFLKRTNGDKDDKNSDGSDS